jgi:hypothetical protein
MERRDIALTATVHALATQMFYDGARPETAFQITVRPVYFDRVEGSHASTLIGDTGETWAERIPCTALTRYIRAIAKRGHSETLTVAINYAYAFIEASGGQEAAVVDPERAAGIGGHTHVATITKKNGFRWEVALSPLSTRG